MKKKFIMTLVMMVLGASLISGCGKSEEQTARDEIMSHMNEDEKTAIAADQQAIADYEAEREAKANEEPIDYTENMVEKSLVDIVRSINSNLIEYSDVNIPDIKILLPDDQYITGSSVSHISYGGTFAIRASTTPLEHMNGDIEECGNYKISMYLLDNDAAGYLYIAGIDSDECLVIESEGSAAVIEKNYDFVKSQLENAEN